MGIDPKTLSDKQVGMIGDPAQRKETVKRRGFETSDKIKAEQEYEQESKLHDDFISFLNRHELGYIHANPKKKSTVQKGCPDFCVTAGGAHGHKSLYVEFKLPGNRLSPVQEEYILGLRRKGCEVLVCYDYASATQETAAFLGLATHLK